MLSRKIDYRKAGVYVVLARGHTACRVCGKTNYSWNTDHGVFEQRRIKMYTMVVVSKNSVGRGGVAMDYCSQCIALIHRVTRPPKRPRKPKTLTWQEEVEQGIREAEKGMSDANLAMNDVFCVLDDSEDQRRLTKEQAKRVLFLRSEAEQFIDDTDYQLEVQS